MSKTVSLKVIEGAKIEGILGIIKRLGFKVKRDEIKIEKENLDSGSVEKLIFTLRKRTQLCKKLMNFVIKYISDVISLNEINDTLLEYKVVTKKEKEIKTNIYDDEIKQIRFDLIISSIFSIPLFISMIFHMLGIHQFILNGYIQWVLASVVSVLCR